jgi:hypothetical protein
MGAMPMYVPDFKTVVMPAVVAAMDEWKADAEKSELAQKLGQMHTQSKSRHTSCWGKTRAAVPASLPNTSVSRSSQG